MCLAAVKYNALFNKFVCYPMRKVCSADNQQGSSLINNIQKLVITPQRLHAEQPSLDNLG
jgi:hypothetical protein